MGHFAPMMSQLRHYLRTHLSQVRSGQLSAYADFSTQALLALELLSPQEWLVIHHTLSMQMS